jgi:hypothetical protein
MKAAGATEMKQAAFLKPRTVGIIAYLDIGMHRMLKDQAKASGRTLAEETTLILLGGIKPAAKLKRARNG